MIPWSIDVRCGACRVTHNLIVDKHDRDKVHACPTCGEDCVAVLSAPAIFKAAHVDGHVDDGLRKLADASRIEAESFNLPHDKREHHDKAIRELTEIKK